MAAKRAETLLDQASGLPESERRGFLESAVGDDSELLSTLNEILGTEDDDFLVPGGALRGLLGNALEDQLEGQKGSQEKKIGPYRLLQRLGRGGMGEVWHAEQREPVRREVAVKLIKLGMDSEEVLARFHGERQAVALMDHSNVARVYDAGTTEAGRPYFVMELVAGLPITTYCDENCLSTRERLKIFLQVCAGVQHAHHKGIIHRDLKPSNILVTREGSEPVPKIIDFGIAKAVGEPLNEAVARTRIGQWIGTPEYMSPEQADASIFDVDTRSDVYSLGAILYELLIGARVFEDGALRGASKEEMRRQIKERDPSRPSERLLSSPATATKVAEKRGTEPSRLNKALKGDLDWIVMKALEKERDRRYNSARELAQDIERHLRNEPVIAGPPSVSYRVNKFVQRHRLAVATAAAITLALVVGAGLATAGFVRARKAEAVAVSEAKKANAINQFLRQILGSARPEGGLGRDITVVEAVNAARERMDESFEDNPEVAADLRTVIGTTHHELGLLEEAQQVLEEAVRMRRELSGQKHEDVAEPLNELARLYHSAGELELAEQAFLEVLEITRAAGPDAASRVAATLNNLGIMYVNWGRQDEALGALTEALEAKRELYGAVHEEVTPTLNNLGMLLGDIGDFEQAEKYLREAYEGNRQIHGPEHGVVAINLSNLASNYVDQERFDLAIETFDQALALKEAAFGKAHTSYGITLTNKGEALDRQGKHGDAAPLHEQALEIFVAALPADSFRIGTARSRYGHNLLARGQLEEAEPQLREGHAILEQSFGPEDARTQKAAGYLAALDKKAPSEPRQ